MYSTRAPVMVLFCLVDIYPRVYPLSTFEIGYNISCISDCFNDIINDCSSDSFQGCRGPCNNGTCDCGYGVCKPGTYGNNCQNNCSTGCSDTCDSVNGCCDCKPGFSGDNCDNPCEPGTYGNNCQNNCSTGCSDTCDSVNGSCDCKPGFSGDNCDNPCESGTYGNNCQNNCSTGCSDTCDSVNGSCDCKPGFRRDNCDNPCEPGTYGNNCQNNCSTGCSDTCDSVNGSCDCKPGFSGDNCDNPCEPGTYGNNCQNNCSTGCNDTCDSVNGSCDCKPGFIGDNCDNHCQATEYNTTVGVFDISRTPVGETFSTSEICHVDKRPLGEVNCSFDEQGRVNWSIFITNRACDYSDLNASDISHRLREILQGTEDVEKMLQTAVIISRNMTLNKLDFFLITNIMEKTRNLSEVSRKVVEFVLALYSKVMKTPDPTLSYVQERAMAVHRILRSLDDLTWKMQPLPNGTWSVHTETILCYTWNLTNQNVFDKLPIGLRLSSADDTGRVDITYNKPEDCSKTDAAIFLSRTFLLNLLNGTRADIRMSVIIHKDPFLFTKASKTEAKYRLISKVLAAKIVVNGAVLTDLAPERVTMIFSKTKVDAGVVKTCGYWNFSLSGWSTDGCELSLGSSNHDVCTCDHLTNFAILLALDRTSDERSIHNLPLSVITTLGLSLSILGLSGTLLSFVTFKKLREKHPQQTLFNLALAELCAWLVFLVGITQTQSHAGCTAVAILLHYFLLASFMWMLAEAFLHYLLLVKVQAQGTFTNRYMLKIGIPAWSIPLIPVLIVLAVDPGLYRGRDRHCWMSLSASIYAFALPVGVVILLNIIIYIMVVVRIFRMSKAQAGSKKGNKKREVLKIRVPILCFVLFGLSWIFGFLAVSEAKVVFQYLFCLTSSTQGFLIFIFFTAGNEEVRQLWSRLCCREKRERLIKNDKKEISRSNMITRTTGDMETSF